VGKDDFFGAACSEIAEQAALCCPGHWLMGRESTNGLLIDT
jgi:hypothetical protein